MIRPFKFNSESLKKMTSRDILPLRTGSDDKISPFKIAVLIFVKEYCSARLAQLGLSTHSNYDVTGPFSPQQCKDFCLLSLELIQSYDVTWEEFEIILEPGQYNLSQKIVSWAFLSEKWFLFIMLYYLCIIHICNCIIFITTGFAIGSNVF